MKDNNNTFIIFYFISVALIIFPVMNILKKAGMKSWKALFLFLPLVGFVYVSFILAFSAWPALAKNSVKSSNTTITTGGE